MSWLPKVEDDERFRVARFEVIAPEGRHLVERARVHASESTLADALSQPRYRKAALLSHVEIQS
jgi:hypothetical protein